MIFVLFFLLFLSAIFSSSETALVSLGKLKTKKIIAEKKIRFLQKWINEPGSVLSGILIGNSVVNICFTGIFTFLILTIFSKFGWNRSIGEFVSIIFVSFIILISGEIIPKTIARSLPEKTVILTSRFLRITFFMFTPLIFVMKKVSEVFFKKPSFTSKITKDELKKVLKIGQEEGVIKREIGEMMQKALTFRGLSVSKIMSSEENIAWVDVSCGNERVIDIFLETGRSRIPVYQGSKKNILGLLYARDILKNYFLKERINIRKLLRKPIFILPDTKCSQLLDDFRKKRIHLALIKKDDEVIGLVTMEDLLEEIVGEIVDEFDLINKRQ